MSIWLEKLNEDNKKGLRVLHKIMEVDGKKRFKVDAPTGDQKQEILIKDVYSVPFEEAQKEFRKITNVTHYATIFGSKPKQAQDFEILKYKKFS